MLTIALEIRTAMRNILRQGRRSFAAMIAIGAGVAALLLAGGFAEFIFYDMREFTIHSQLGHIQIYHTGYRDSGMTDPYDHLLADDTPQRLKLEQQPHITALAPRLNFSGLISHDDATLSFAGEGMDPVQEREISRYLIIKQGNNLSPDDPHGILLGAGLALNLGVSVGDTVVLVTNTKNGGINAVEATVRGLFSTVSEAYDNNALRTPITLARDLLRVTGAHAWVLLLDDTQHAPALWKTLQHTPHPEYEFVLWSQLADFYNKTVILFKRQTNIISLIIAVIIVLSISNTMMMNVLERTGEIGTTMALGRTRKMVLRQFLIEGLVLGLLGGCSGIIFGALLAALLSAIGIPMPPPPGSTESYDAQIYVTPSLMLTAFTLALAATLIASFYPAWKASRQQIVDALRHNR